MDPQLSSVLTSIALAAATSVAAYFASKGLIPSADQSVFANQLVTLGAGLVMALIGWYKARQLSQTSMIAAVNNADNGLKVVASTVQAPTATIPIPSTSKGN